MKRIIAPQGNILWEKIVNPRPLDPEDELYSVALLSEKAAGNPL